MVQIYLILRLFPSYRFILMDGIGFGATQHDH